MSQIPIPQREIDAFCRRWRVRELSLFGSAAHGEFRPGSDVDLLIAFEDGVPWSLFDLVTMKDELEEIFGRPVDLVERDALRNPYRRSAILSTREILHAA